MWKRVALSEILIERNEQITSEYLKAKSIKVIEKISFNSGMIKMRSNNATRTKMILVHPGDLVISGINAIKGAIGVYDSLNSEPIAATIHYSSYIPKPKQIDLRYLWRLLRSDTFREILGRYLSSGIKTELKAKKFLSVQVPLPPYDRQIRIIKTIDKLIAKIEYARLIFDEISLESKKMWNNALREQFKKLDCPLIELRTVCKVIDNLHSTPKYDDYGFLCIRSQDISWGKINYDAALATSGDEFKERTRRGEPRRGDIAYVREGDIGRCAIVDGSHRFSLGQRVMIIRPNLKDINSRFLFYQLWSPTVLDDQVRASKTGMTARHVNITFFKSIQIKVPPMEEQLRLVSYFDSLLSTVDRLQHEISDNRPPFDHLEDSILDRIFTGVTK